MAVAALLAGGLGCTPPGNRLLQGNYAVIGVTSDDHLVVADRDKASIGELPAAGGDLQVLFTNVDFGRINREVVGAFFFFWQYTNPRAAIGRLSWWSAATGTRQVADQSFAGQVTLTSDGTRIVFTANATPDGYGDLIGASADLSSMQTLASHVDVLADSACATANNFVFRGETLLVAHCESATPPAALTAFDAGWKAVDLIPNLHDPGSWQLANESVFAVDSERKLYAVPLGGGAPVLIDGGVSTDVDNSIGTDVSPFPDGSGVIYATLSPTRALKQATLAGPTPRTLVDGDAVGVRQLSGGGRLALYYAQEDASNQTSDLRLVAPSGGPVLTVEPQPIASAAFFTADDSAVLYTTDLDPSNNNTSKLWSHPTAGPGDSTLVASAVYDWALLPGAGLLFNDHYLPSGVADLHLVDIGHGRPTQLVDGADAAWVLDRARAYVIYSFNPFSQGVYSIALH